MYHCFKEAFNINLKFANAFYLCAIMNAKPLYDLIPLYNLIPLIHTYILSTCNYNMSTTVILHIKCSLTEIQYPMATMISLLI